MNKVWQISLLAGDLAWLTLSLFITYSIRMYATGNDFQFSLLLAPFSILFAIWILLFFIFNLYESESVNPNPKNIGKLVLVILINLGLGVLFFYMFPSYGIAPKLSLIFVSSISFVLLVIWRRFFYTISRGTFAQSLILVGNHRSISAFQGEIKSHPYIKENILLEETSDVEEKIKKILGDKNQFVIVVENYSLLQKLLPLTEKYNCKIVTLLSAYESIMAKIPVDILTEEESVLIATNRETLVYQFFHAIFDRVVALSILIVMSPFLVLAVISILVESGFPFIYKQTRVGKNGKIFNCYKLRSMVKNAEKDGAKWASENDTRITPLGKILRKTHIDEIPQMWNILSGDIALVGPRPERPEFVDKLKLEIPHYFLRHTIRPGFTGWAQIKYRYARTVEDSREKFEYDLYYIKNRNVFLDFGIIIKTIQIIVTHI